MSALILYDTKGGFTKEQATDLSEQVPKSKVFNLSSKDYTVEDYDTILVGAPIYKGELSELAKLFFIKHKKILKQKRLGIFCAGMNIPEFNEAIQESLPPDIFYHAYIVHCGGRIIYESLSFKDKFTIKRRLGIKEDTLVSCDDKMQEFLSWIQED
jgi:menaquinone-dependent protoporphyrinogen oxidase